MPKFDQTSAECLIYTFKEGVLSPVAHDLVIRVTDWEVEIDLEGGHVGARFDPTSLRVVDAARNKVPLPGKLSDKDKKKIEDNIRKDVLQARKFEHIRFLGTSVVPQGDGFRIDGRLHLHGKQMDMSLVSHAEGDQQVIEARLHQPDFGIKPFTAMMGALRIKPDIEIRVSLPIKNG